VYPPQRIEKIMTIFWVGATSSSSVYRITKEFAEKFEKILSKRIETKIP